jgi:hypothetical protein
LKALKAQAQEAAEKPVAEQAPEAPALKFRNYHVKDVKRIEHEQVGFLETQLNQWQSVAPAPFR